MMTVHTTAMTIRVIEISREMLPVFPCPLLVTFSYSEVGVVLTAGEGVLLLAGGVCGLLLFSVEVSTGS